MANTVFDRETTGLEVVKRFADQVEGKTIVITGAGERGLGAQTAIDLAHANPAHLVLTARTQPRVESVIAKIKELNPKIKVTFVPLQLDDFDNVRTAAKTISHSIDKLDILINNAGIMNTLDYTTNGNGIEIQFATDHLGHFLLTSLLLPKILSASPGARIVNVSSGGHYVGPVRFDDYNFDDGKDYDGWSAYGQAKTANILFSRSLAEKLGSKGVFSYSLHPGSIATTSLGVHVDDWAVSYANLQAATLKNTGRPLGQMAALKTSEQGSATQLIAALDPQYENVNGAYFDDSVPAEPAEHARSLEDAEKLWKLSEQLVGEKFVV